MKSLGARRIKKSEAQSAVAEKSGSGSDAGAPPAAHESSSTDALPKRSTDDETNTDDTRNDLELDSDDHTNGDPAERGATHVMNRPPEKSRRPVAVESKGKYDPNIEWTALLNLLVKKNVLSHEEVRVEIELLKRNRSG